MSYVFDEFFTSGQEESISPFLEKKSRHFGKNLRLKSSLCAAFFLLLAFIFSFYSLPISDFCLLFVYFLAGTKALINTLEDIKNFEINIDVLMTLAAFLSFAIGSQMEGALLLVLFSLSGSMEEAVSKKAKSSLIRLNELSPRIAIVIKEDGQVFEQAVQEVTVGSTLLVKAGEVVPLDGLVISGSSFVNLVHLTGESAPVPKKKGAEIQAGSRNLDGTLSIKVTKTSRESTLSKIITLIGQAQEMKPKLERFLDRFGKPYAITIISLSAFFACILPVFFSIPFLGEEGSIYRALTFLIAASPCALIIATPTAYLSAVNACARKGILVKGGIALDAFASCKMVAFDKTGTLTTGKLSCSQVKALNKDPICSEEQAISIAASLERHVTHPIGQAICELANDKKLPPSPIKNFKSIPGFGLQASIEIDGKEKKVLIGNKEFIQPPIEIEEESMLTFLQIDQTFFVFYFLDTLRPDIKPMLTRLKTKLKLIMLTGDHQKSAEKVAKDLEIAEFRADLRPEHKLKTVSDLSKNHHLAMVGDGINDAPALARATVGISLGKIGSTSALDASDIIFLHDDLTLLDWLYSKAHKTINIIKQNITLALSVIFLVTTPALLGFIPLWLAVILHEGGTVLVGLNSLRLLKTHSLY